MTKSGGGRGTNQHQIRGTSRQAPRAAADHASLPPAPSITLGRAGGPDIDVAALSSDGIVSSSVERVVSRFDEQMAYVVLSDAALEGNRVFTLPEIETLVDAPKPDSENFDELQVLDLIDAVKHLSEISRSGAVVPSPKLSREINRIIVANEVIEPGLFRGEGTVSGGGNVDTPTGRFRAIQPSAEPLADVFSRECHVRIESIDDPVISAVVYASWASYHQFHANGNKRTARHVMNAMLMSRGYDAIVVPTAREREYQEALIVLFDEHDGTTFSQLLLDLARPCR